MRLALDIQQLTKKYDDRITALNDVSLQVEEGDFFALIGPNGAGKSTLIGVLTSLIRKTFGRVSVFGFDIDKNHLEAKTCMGVMPQEFNFNMFARVEDVVLNQAGFYGMKSATAKRHTQALLEKLSLWDRRHAEVRQLSGGMKRRLMLARALVHQPKLLILDEPTAGVDIELRRSLWSFLKEENQKGLTIILTTHYLEEAEQLCRNVAIIDKGRMIRNMPVSQLLKELDRESFILYPSQPIDEIPHIDGFKLKRLDDGTIEAEMPKQATVTHLLKSLHDKKIVIDSLRNKANRLEELFVHLTEK